MTVGPTVADATSRLFDDLQRALTPAAGVTVDLGERRTATKDYSWLSPVLRRTLPRTLPDIVVRPTTTTELRAVVGLCHRHGVAFTPRGRGTSNYGQVVPLASGVVADISRLHESCLVEDGRLRTGAGTSFTKMAVAAQRHGQELAMFPSTTGSTLAGFVAGGSGGPGSIEQGWNHEGFVTDLVVLPCVDAPEPVAVHGSDACRPHVHAYGTTGVIAEATVRLVPAREWMSVFASFTDFDDAAAAGQRILDLAVAPRLLAVTEPGLARLFPEDPGLVDGEVSVRALVERSCMVETTEIVEGHGGRVVSQRDDATNLLVSLINNHTTLRAQRADPRLHHVLIRGDAVVGQIDLIHDAFPGAQVQLEGTRLDGRRTYGGRLLAPFLDEDATYAGMAALAAAGIGVDDPHTWEVTGDLDDKRAVAAQLDPDGLLNPGKLPAA